MTIYASPAFWQASDLYTHVSNDSVVDHSNIASVEKLKGHGHYSYTEPGYIGKGHSETVDIESEPLSVLITSGFERNDGLPLNQHLKKTAAAIIEATSSSDLIAPVFYQVQRALGHERLDPNSLYDATVIVEIFSEAFGVRCYALAP